LNAPSPQFRLGLIEEVGRVKFDGARAFVKYAIKGRPKPRQVVEQLPNGHVRVSYV
jgi:hypothetical protein